MPTTPTQRRAEVRPQFTDESLHGPRLPNGRFTPMTASMAAIVAREDLSASLRRLHADKARAFRQRASARTEGKKLAADAPRKRAPRKPRLPADLSTIDPRDFRMRLKAEGFTTARGVRYFMALLKMQGAGTTVSIPASTNLPAHALLEQVGRLGSMNAWNPSLHLSCCPDSYALRVRWLDPEEPIPEPYRSRFGLDQLVGCGEFVDIPISAFPQGMTRVVRVRALYLDHAVSRRNPKQHHPKQVDVLATHPSRPDIHTVVLKAADQDLKGTLGAV